MEITCPNCAQTCEVDDEPTIGQHLLCPLCDTKFSYSPQSENGVDAGSIANTAEMQTEKPPAQIQTSCPHCGATYEVDAADVDETAVCETCGNEFIVEKPSKDKPAAAAPGNKRVKAILAKAKSAAKAIKSIPRLVCRIIKITKNAIVKFQHRMAEPTKKMVEVGDAESIRYREGKNNFIISFAVVIAIIGLLNIGVLGIGVYLGWQHLKGQESSHEAMIARLQAEYDEAQSRREQEEREEQQRAQSRREQEEREERRRAQLRREQEEIAAAQILSQLLMNGNSGRQSTSSEWNDCLRSVIKVGGGEGARQVQVYEDEMIRQRARQGMPLW